MHYLKAYFITNVFLLVIGAIMLFLAFYNIKSHKKTSLYIIAITGLVFILSLAEALHQYFKDITSISGATITSFLGYILRPLCVIIFIMLSGKAPKGKWLLLFFVPFFINFFIFLLSFIPGTRHLVFYFIGGDGSIAFQAGPLRFTSHIVAALYLIYFVFISIYSLKLKHFSNAIIILICVFFIVLCVILETFFDDSGEVHLLNTGIMLCVMSYYLFLFIERMRYDTLTGLFNRTTYYQDSLRMRASTTAIIQFDLNGLKYLNDNFGHDAGDKAIQTVAKIIVSRCRSSMYAYRMGGDEFIVIANNTSEGAVKSFVEKIKEDLSQTQYTCAIGFAFREDRKITLEELIKSAEQEMYASKAEFYKTSKIERRKV